MPDRRRGRVEARRLSDLFGAALGEATSREQQHLQDLAWAARVLRALPHRPANLNGQFVALYDARRAELGRLPDSEWCIRLQFVSREIWNVATSLRPLCAA